MSELLPAILVSSLLGSVHCLAMCGPLVVLHGGRASLRLSLVHALGRLTTYATLGALAGLVGRVIDVAGQLGDVQRGAAIVAALVILTVSGHAIATAAGWIRPATTRGAAFRSGLVRLRDRRPPVRPWLTGMVTGLLPCGWLWAFVVAAAGTASWGGGALVMATFWLGTVPAMTGALTIAAPLVARVRQRMPVITALILLGLGLGTLAVRWADAGASGVEQPHCHEVQS